MFSEGLANLIQRPCYQRRGPQLDPTSHRTIGRPPDKGQEVQTEVGRLRPRLTSIRPRKHQLARCRPDMTFAVDWAFKAMDLSIILQGAASGGKRSVRQKKRWPEHKAETVDTAGVR